jgi:uncharacterized protein YxeA
MKKIVLTVLFVLILILSSVLIYHAITNEPVKVKQTIDDENVTSSDISNEIDDVLLEEDDEIDIGDMI